MKTIGIILLGAVFAFSAGDPAGFRFWKSSELKMYSQTLSPKVDATKLASEKLLGSGNRSYVMVHREGTGESEIHEALADVIIVQSGEGTLVYGGEMVEGRTTAPHEIRGRALAGGMEKPLMPGDIVEMPPKVPHWVKVAPGKQITYLVVKVTQ